MGQLKLAFVPYPLQQEIIDHIDGKIKNKHGRDFRFFIATLGRQSGKSWLAKYLLIEHAGNRGETCMWVAPTIPTARGHWNNLIQLIKDAGLKKVGIVTKISQSAKEIHFNNGGSISVRSAIEPDNLRGASLNLLILDEAAFFRNGKYVWYSVCLPMISATMGKVVFTTTPNGRNYVYDLYRRGLDDDDKYYKSWNFNSYVSPYQDKDLLDDLRTTMPSIQWREEFMAEFIPDGGGVFAGVERAATIDMLLVPLKLHRYVMGIDMGFSNDYTCITVIDILTRQQVWGIRFTGIGTVSTIKRIIDAAEQWRPEKIIIEKNGGEYFVDLLRTVMSGGDVKDIVRTINDVMEDDPDTNDTIDKVDKFKIQAIHMDNPKKRYLVERLASDIEFGRFKILAEKEKYGETQISEMSTFERTPTNSGMSVTYQASDENHDDTVSALYLAYQGVKPYSRTKSLSKGKLKRNPFKPTSGKGGLGRFRRRKNA